MFYRLIEQKRNAWYASPECTVHALLDHIRREDKMRDAQVEAIKTYLFLKIACRNRPLSELFSEGYFTDLEEEKQNLRRGDYYTLATLPPAALSLFCYARLKTKGGKQLSPRLEQFVLDAGETIDYRKVFNAFFYGVDYPDYLFSLPMGAGKTYLMAAFIYLDLYFASLEPNNPAFAHNFMIMAPSGTKTSILPSLKTMKAFNPAWIIPEPAAGELRKLVHFEILDEQKASSNSNRVKNPNAQKLANLQPFEDLMGLVAITNAEKVILNKVDKGPEPPLLASLDAEERQANELRSLIAKIPHLAIYIDEVHHAADGEIKLRQVVKEWNAQGSCCGVLGFSGTPHLAKAENVRFNSEFSIKNTDLSNVVYYYPLSQGVGNFLKVPEVRYCEGSTEDIVQKGLEDFLNLYAHTAYPSVGNAKLAIYCGKIHTLEEVVFPLVARILRKRGLDPAQLVLKFHRGNRAYPKAQEAECEFAALDSEISTKRIILLAQIGKEGWDCRSLTGVILPHAGACEQNNVLQTCCRCLRQVVPHSRETALVWLNQSNADILNSKLRSQCDLSITELNHLSERADKCIRRYSRADKLKVPPMDFCQLYVHYETILKEDAPHTMRRLAALDISEEKESPLAVVAQDLEGNRRIYDAARTAEIQQPITFRAWLSRIAKGSFGFLTTADLLTHEERLREIFLSVSEETMGIRRLSPLYKHTSVESLIRQCFVPERECVIRKELKQEAVSLLREEKLTDAYEDSLFYPPAQEVQKILKNDSMCEAAQAEAAELFARLESLGYHDATNALERKDALRRTYHYLPYHFDSSPEMAFFKQLFATQELQDRNLEFYYNGDDTLTEFKIRCYSQQNRQWRFNGLYVPDFLIFSRTPEGRIHQVLIVEMKGEGYAAKFAPRKSFMEEAFIKYNNEHFDSPRFAFLYLEDSQSEAEWHAETMKAIRQFFINF